jgi:hypothetical protein
MVYSSLQRSVSVRSRGNVIIMHTPSTSDACEMHAQSVEKYVASLALRFCWHWATRPRTVPNYVVDGIDRASHIGLKVISLI